MPNLTAGAVLLLLGASALLGACSEVDSSAMFGGKSAPERVPVSLLPTTDTTGRPAHVAFISACAQAYGFVHDPAKLRTAYVSYEAARGLGNPQLATIEQDYDAAYTSIMGLDSSRKSSYCSSKHGDEVGAELKRYQSGYFEERPVAPQQAFNQEAFWRSSACTGAC